MNKVTCMNCVPHLSHLSRRVTCVDFTDDSSMLAAGLQNSNIRVWSLTPNKLRGMKSTMELEIIDKEAGRALCVL